MEKYQSYKPSDVEWIGEIPSEWSMKRLTYSFKIQKGKIPSDLVNEPILNGLPYLSMDVLRGNEPTEFSSDKNIVEVKDGDIGILWDGSNSGEIIKIRRKGILSSTVSLLSIVDNDLNKEFGYYLLKLFEGDFKSNTTGMGIPHVNGNYIRETKLIIPPLSEQHQIVQFLDSKTELIDKLISTKERKITLLKEQRTSLINQVVTKGLNPNVKMKNSGVEWIGEIPESWLITRIGFISELLTGNPWKSDLFDFEEGLKIVRGENVSEGFLRWGDRTRYWKHEVIKGDMYFLNEGDIVISMDGSKVGKNYVLINQKDLPLLLHQRMCRVRCKDVCSSRFLNYFVGSNMFRYYIDITKTDPMIPHITQKDISNFKLPLPSIEEQLEITEFLDSRTKEINDMVQFEQKKIDLLKEYRQSLISEVVTGKIKVTE